MALRPTVYLCPGCGISVEPGEDFVVAREHKATGDFDLHSDVRNLPVGAERWFHVQHFRSRIGDYVYELVDHEAR